MSETPVKRAEERLTINKEFESFDAFIQEYVTNISRTGVFIKSQTPLPIGTEVNLRFTVIMEDIETIEGLGVVVRVEENPAGMGVVFRELNAYSRDLIDDPSDEVKGYRRCDDPESRKRENEVGQTAWTRDLGGHGNTQSPRQIPRSRAVRIVSQSSGTVFIRPIASSSGT